MHPESQGSWTVEKVQDGQQIRQAYGMWVEIIMFHWNLGELIFPEDSEIKWMLGIINYFLVGTEKEGKSR